MFIFTDVLSESVLYDATESGIAGGRMPDSTLSK